MDYPREFVAALVALSGGLPTDRGLDGTLARVSRLATEQISGCDFAGCTLVRDGKATTSQYTDPLSPKIDRAQYESGRGPCLDAYRTGTICRIDDTHAENPWPEFSAAAAEHGIRSTISFPLAGDEAAIGALNLYSRAPQNFVDNDDISIAVVAHASALLASAQAYWSAHELSEHLQTAMLSRSVIEQAKGIIMGARSCDAEAAFAELQHTSQHQNRKLRDIAADVVNRQAP
jgi:putative methionine-R-sulfoxide reductase with GAF domain